VSTEKGITVQILAVSGNQGTMIIFDALTLDGRPCRVAVDSRTALEIDARLIASTKGDKAEPCYAEVGSWQLVGYVAGEI
jgi:hypothetical protein